MSLSVEILYSETNISMHTILYVDSDPQELEKVSLSLRENGYEVIPARNPGEAMEWLSQSPPTIVLTDIEFPGLESEKVIKNFIKISPDSVFIIYTKREERRIGEDRRLDKIFEFISKPTDNITLMGHLRRAEIFGKKRLVVCSTQPWGYSSRYSTEPRMEARRLG